MPRFSTTNQTSTNRGMFVCRAATCCCIDAAGVYSFTVPTYNSPSPKLGLPGMIVCVIGAGGGGASGTSCVNSSCVGNGADGTAGGGSCFGSVTADGGGAGCKLPTIGSSVGSYTSNMNSCLFCTPYCCFGWFYAGYAPPASYSGCFSSATSGATFSCFLCRFYTCCTPGVGFSSGGSPALLCISLLAYGASSPFYLSSCAICRGLPTDGIHPNGLIEAFGVTTNLVNCYLPVGIYRGCGGGAGIGFGCFQGGTNVSTSSVMVGAPGGNGAVAIKYYKTGDLTPSGSVSVCVGSPGSGGTGWPCSETRTTLSGPCFHLWPDPLGFASSGVGCYNSFYTKGIAGTSGTVNITYFT
jgi:hypothetical protein